MLTQSRSVSGEFVYPAPDVEPDLVRGQDEVGRFDHSYLLSVLLLRWGITFTYLLLVLAGVIPMHPLALLGSASWLAFTSVLATWYFRRRRPAAWYDSSYIVLDSLSVTFGVLAAANLGYPIWLTYIMLMLEASAERTTRFSAFFNFWCLALYLLCAGVVKGAGWYDPSTASLAVTAIMMLFIGLDLTITFDGNRRLRAYIRRMSVTDPLTGLANRRRLSDALGHVTSAGRSMAVIILDVDGFKPYNDTYGHLAGDHLLQRLARILDEEFPDASIISRYGGDEFVVLLPCGSAREAAERAGRLVNGRSAGRIPVSVGLAVWPEHEATLDAALAAADDCLRTAKRSHKGGLVSR